MTLGSLRLAARAQSGWFDRKNVGGVDIGIERLAPLRLVVAGDDS